MKRLLFALLAILSLHLIVSCETFDSPPRITIAGAVNGVLSDRTGPLRIEFSEPIVRDTMKLMVVAFTPDDEGDLRALDAGDETSAPPLRIYYQYDLSNGVGGEFDPRISGGKEQFLDQDATFLISPNAPLPVGTRLALVIESGLADAKGNKTNVRKIVPFSYEFKCAGNKVSTVLKTGPYFFLLQIEKPLQVQVQLYSWLDVNPANGQFVGQFTSGDRNLGLTCPMPCTDTQKPVCRLKPEPECVKPAEAALSPDEYTDFGINPVTEGGGFTFPVSGCSEDQADGTAVMATVPSTVDLVAGGLKVTVNGLIVAASFTKATDGVLRASGSGTGGEVVFGGARAPGAAGTLTARDLPEAPNGLPKPTTKP